MLSVDAARAAILAGAGPLGAEEVSLSDAPGRILAADVAARATQPPFAASAMDGYAVRFTDAKAGARLSVIGEAPAGRPFAGAVGEEEAVRIFTGAPVPAGADAIVIQENASRDGDVILIETADDAPRHIRAAGLDFEEGAVLARAGERLHALHGSLFAAANIDRVPVIRRPRITLFTNGDELVEPGAALAPGAVVNANPYALAAMVAGWGGEARDLGCAPDRTEAVAARFGEGRGADVIVPVGGASVGDYDVVKTAFRAAGGEIVFENVAVRPGKPTWFGRLGGARVVGLPGNPASAIVSAALFVQPLIRVLTGDGADAGGATAALTADLPANGPRAHYMRAAAAPSPRGFEAAPETNQDSALLSPFARANALIRRAPNAPPARAGETVEIVFLR